MTSRQLEANRKNGAKSTGPKTPEGKRKSSQNSLKHRMTALDVVLSTENPDEYNLMRSAYHGDFAPVGRVESDLVDEMVTAKWRQRRCCCFEKDIINQKVEEQRANPYARYPGMCEANRAADAFRSMADGSKALQDISRFESRYCRSYQRALKDLLTLQKLRREREPAEAVQIEEVEAGEVPDSSPAEPAKPSSVSPLSPADLPENQPIEICKNEPNPKNEHSPEAL